MPKTKQEIATEVLQEVGELATGQTPSDADARICRDKYDQVYSGLLSNKLVSWGPDDSVPDDAVLPIVALVARSVTTIFGVSGTTLQDIAAKSSVAEGMLRNLMTVDYSEETTPISYF